jgi:hypothetical protein
MSARPLTVGEIELGRSRAVRKGETREAVCWALAKATAVLNSGAARGTPGVGPDAFTAWDWSLPLQR